MIKQFYNVIGVMSGTSLDGVDLAHIHFSIDTGKWKFEIIKSKTIAYSKEWLEKLKKAIHFSQSELKQLNEDYTKLLAEIINNFIANHQISDLDAVCSHGHTILHQPHNGFTLQIGNLPQIAQYLNQKVVCDFRVQDVKLGGQGAPLVPIGDEILFSEFTYCLNLGGFSNISFSENGKRIAFDISPVNTVLNFYANQLNVDYDDKGNFAKSGNLNQKLFEELNDLEFYKIAYPKSLGFEFVKETVFPLMESVEISVFDKMNTFVHHAAFQISKVINHKQGSLLITGGGAYNDFLIETIRYYAPEIKIVIPDRNILEYKEALIFALLGVLKLRGENNVLSSVTGAQHDHSSGNIFV